MSWIIASKRLLTNCSGYENKHAGHLFENQRISQPIYVNSHPIGRHWNPQGRNWSIVSQAHHFVSNCAMVSIEVTDPELMSWSRIRLSVPEFQKKCWKRLRGSRCTVRKGFRGAWSAREITFTIDGADAKDLTMRSINTKNGNRMGSIADVSYVASSASIWSSNRACLCDRPSSTGVSRTLVQWDLFFKSELDRLTQCHREDWSPARLRAHHYPNCHQYDLPNDPYDVTDILAGDEEKAQGLRKLSCDHQMATLHAF